MTRAAKSYSWTDLAARVLAIPRKDSVEQVPVYDLRMTVCIDVQLEVLLDHSWIAGPLCVSWRDGKKRLTSTASTRSYYYEAWVPGAILRRGSRHLRWYRSFNLDGPAGVEISKAEILITDQGDSPECKGAAVLALHVQADALDAGQIVQAIYECTNFSAAHGQDMRSLVGKVIPRGALASTVRRAMAISLVTPRNALRAPFEVPGDPVDMWLHVLGSQGRTAGAATHVHSGRVIRPSPDYVVHADRLGLGVLALGSEREISSMLRFFAATNYTDVVLLHCARIRILEILEAEASKLIGQAAPQRSDVEAFRRRIQRFRARYLPSSFAPQGPYTECLAVLDEEARIGARFAALRQDVNDLFTVVQTRNSDDISRRGALFASLALPSAFGVGVWQGLAAGATLADLLLWFGMISGIAFIVAWVVLLMRKIRR